MASPLSHTQWHQCSIKALGQDEEEAMVRFKYLDPTKAKQNPTQQNMMIESEDSHNFEKLQVLVGS